jgi:hypothetical protein
MCHKVFECFLPTIFAKAVGDDIGKNVYELVEKCLQECDN